MNKFDSILETYKNTILTEQPAPPPDPQGPPPGPDAGGAPPPPPGGPEGDMPEEPEGPSPEDVVNELVKASKKPWADLASILCRAIDYNFKQSDKDEINSKLPGGLTIYDFISITTETDGTDPVQNIHDPNVVSGALNLFDSILPEVMESTPDTVEPAEEI